MINSDSIKLAQKQFWMICFQIFQSYTLRIDGARYGKQWNQDLLQGSLENFWAEFGAIF